MNKVIRDGKVAVLYSPGFGAGWYSWNTDVKELLFDPEIVAMVEAGRNDEIGDFAEEKYKDNMSFYGGGSYNLKIKWIDQGNEFFIDEYDGSESIRVTGQNEGLFA